MDRYSYTALLLPLIAVARAQAGTPPAPAIDTLTVTERAADDGAARDYAERALTPGAVSIVELDEFRERAVGSLADVLRYVPGVWSVSTAGNDGIFFSSRGSNLDATDYDMNGIKLLQDGLPVTAADGSNHNRVIDPLSAQRATIARGANGLKYGAATLGGAIDFTTPTGRELAGVNVSAETGSHGQRSARATFADAGESVDGLVTIESKRWDGYREHNEQRRAGLYANAGWQLSEALETRVYATLLSNDRELPGSLSRAELEADPGRATAAATGGDYRLDVDTWRLASKTTWRTSAGELEAGLSMEQQTLFHPIVDRVLVDPDGAGPAQPIEVFSLLIDTRHRDWAAMLRHTRSVGAHDVLVGLGYGANSVEGGHYRNLGGARNGLRERVDNEASSLELFATDRWRLGDESTLVLALQAAHARRDVRTTDVASGIVTRPVDSYSRVNPSIGFVHDAAEGRSFYASVGTLFEAPTSYELEDNVAGNGQTLDAMKGKVVEVGARGERRAGEHDWSWDVSLYRARIEDEILSTEDPAAPGTNLTTNVDSTIHAGLEGAFGARFALGEGRYLEPRASVSFNAFELDGDPQYGNNDLPAAPRYVVRGELIYRSANGFFAGPTLELVGERYADFANTYEIGSHGLLGARAGWSSDRLSVFLEARNIEDETYVASHGVRARAAADEAILNAGAPRSFYVGFTMDVQ